MYSHRINSVMTTVMAPTSTNVHSNQAVNPPINNPIDKVTLSLILLVLTLVSCSPCLLQQLLQDIQQSAIYVYVVNLVPLDVPIHLIKHALFAIAIVIVLITLAAVPGKRSNVKESPSKSAKTE